VTAKDETEGCQQKFGSAPEKTPQKNNCGGSLEKIARRSCGSTLAKKKERVQPGPESIRKSPCWGVRTRSDKELKKARGVWWSRSRAGGKKEFLPSNRGVMVTGEGRKKEKAKRGGERGLSRAQKKKETGTYGDSEGKLTAANKKISLPIQRRTGRPGETRTIKKTNVKGRQTLRA